MAQRIAGGLAGVQFEEFVWFLAQNARNRPNCPLAPVRFSQAARDLASTGAGIGEQGLFNEREGSTPGGFIPRSRGPCAIGHEGHQLAHPGDARYFCDQLVHDRQARNRGLHRRYRDRDQNRVVLSARAALGIGALGPSLTDRFLRNPVTSALLLESSGRSHIHRRA